MIKNKFFQFLLSILIISPSFAGLGRVIPNSNVPSNLCLLDYSSKESELFTSVCSGILLNSRTILTASHCLEREMPQAIFCGPQLVKVEFERTANLHPLYNKNEVIGNVVLPTNDVALIELTNSIESTPLDFITLEMVSEEKVSCGIFGFSHLLGKLKNEAQNITRGWQVDLNNIEIVEDHPILKLIGLKAPGALLQVGDSGGPLMCWSQGKWKLLGINSSRDYDTNSYFMAVNEFEFATQAKDDFPTIPYKETTIDKIKTNYLNQEVDTLIKKVKRLQLSSSTIILKLEEIEEALKDGYSSEQIRRKAIELERDVKIQLLKTPDLALRIKPYSLLQVEGESKIRSTGDLIYSFFVVHNVDEENNTASGRFKILGPSDYFSCLGDLLCRTQEYSKVTVNIEDIDLVKVDARRIFPN